MEAFKRRLSALTLRIHERNRIRLNGLHRAQRIINRERDRRKATLPLDAHEAWNEAWYGAGSTTWRLWNSPRFWVAVAVTSLLLATLLQMLGLPFYPPYF